MGRPILALFSLHFFRVFFRPVWGAKKYLKKINFPLDIWEFPCYYHLARGGRLTLQTSKTGGGDKMTEFEIISLIIKILHLFADAIFGVINTMKRK